MPWRLRTLATVLIAHGVAQIRQCASDAIVTPGFVSSCDLKDQLFKLRIDGRPTRLASLFRSVELLGDESAVPGEDRVRRNDTGHPCEQRPAEAFADLGQRPSLAVGKPEPATNLSSQNAVLGDEVLVPEKKILVHGAGDVGEEAFPGHDAMVAHALREPGRLWRECSSVSSPSLDLPQCSSILTGRGRNASRVTINKYLWTVVTDVARSK